MMLGGLALLARHQVLVLVAVLLDGIRPRMMLLVLLQMIALPVQTVVFHRPDLELEPIALHVPMVQSTRTPRAVVFLAHFPVDASTVYAQKVRKGMVAAHAKPHRHVGTR